MSRNRDNSGNSPKETGPSPLLQAGIFGALGFQFVAVVIVSYFMGDWLDDKYGTSPWGVLVLIILGMVGTGIHTYRITKRFVMDEEEDVGD